MAIIYALAFSFAYLIESYTQQFSRRWARESNLYMRYMQIIAGAKLNAQNGGKTLIWWCLRSPAKTDT